jgi:hypothetical protein
VERGRVDRPAASAAIGNTSKRRIDVLYPDQQDQGSVAPRAGGGRRAAWLILMTLMLAVVAFPLPAAAAGSVTDLQITAGSADPAAGVAVISGTVSCSEATAATVFTVVRQGPVRGRPIEAAGATTLTCGPAPTSFRIEATPTLDSGNPHPGPAAVNVFVECGLGCFLGEDRELRLTAGRP